MTKEKMRIVTILGFLVVGSVLVVQSALAVPGETRPGWGKGDKNHVHTGPPGTSVNPTP
jgi:hypothetical protein